MNQRLLRASSRIRVIGLICAATTLLTSLSMATALPTGALDPSDSPYRVIDTLATVATGRVERLVAPTFANAARRIPDFVDRVWDRRENEEFWNAEFCAMVLDPKSMALLVDSIEAMYRDDVRVAADRLAASVAGQARQDLDRIHHNLRKISIKIEIDTAGDLAKLENSLPTARQMGRNIYSKLEASGLNRPSDLEVLRRKARAPTAVLGGVFLCAIWGGSAVPIVVPALIFSYLAVDLLDSSVGKERYVAAVDLEFGKQREFFTRILKEGYRSLLTNCYLRAKEQVDADLRAIIEKYVKENRLPEAVRERILP